MFMPIWSLLMVLVIAIAVAVVTIVAIFQHLKIQTLRYCYQMLAYHTPQKQRQAALDQHNRLLRRAGMKPIREEIFEPHPFAELE